MWSYILAVVIHDCIISVSLSSAAIPGIPQNVTANTIVMNSGDCVILLRWMPPSIAESGSSIEHYIIDSPSGIFTTRDTSLVITLLIHHCNNATYIGIHAIDYCGQDGPSTNDTLGQLLIGPSDSTTQPVTATPTADNGGSNQRSGEHRVEIALLVASGRYVDIENYRLFFTIDQELAIVSGTLGSLLFIGILILVALSIALVSKSIVEYNYGHLTIISPVASCMVITVYMVKGRKHSVHIQCPNRGDGIRD